MLKNYFKVAIRSLLRHKSYSFINIFGLSIGFTCCMLIVLFIQNELSYDRFHDNLDNIVRAHRESRFDGNVRSGVTTPTALLPTLKKSLPEVQTGVRLFNVSNFGPTVVKYENRLFQETRFFFADSTFFDVFSFKLTQGNPKEALTQPNSVVLTKSIARKFFGAEDPIGKNLLIDNRREYKVTGVMEDIPKNSHIHPDFVASFSSLRASREEIWGSANYSTYLLLHEEHNLKAMQAKIDARIEKELSDWITNEGDYMTYKLMPLKDIHLKSELNEIEPGGDIRYVYIFSAIALLILVIACINYMNLATARSSERAKEVGLRKVMGAFKAELFKQFMNEALIISFLALILSFCLVYFILPYFNNLTEREITFYLFDNPLLLWGSIGITLFVGFLAGSYPALALSSFSPSVVLKGNFKTSQSGTLLRKILVVFQFSVSMLLIVGTVVVFRQLHFIQNKNLGYDKDHVLVLPMDREIINNLSTLKTELVRNPSIHHVSAASESPTEIRGGYSINVQGMEDDDYRGITALSVDYDFVKTMGLKLLSGNDYTITNFENIKGEDDDQYAFILNESALKHLDLELKNAIGKKATMNGRSGKIKGVINDFHFASLHKGIEPLTLFIEPWAFNYVFVKTSSGNITETLTFVESKWKDLFPHRPFEFEFVDAQFDQLYRSEQQIGQVFGVFALIAILIACLGLFGLASFTATQRIKEIGVRKVLGASVFSVVTLLSKDFTRLVIIAFLISAPIAYYIMNRWLESFTYRISVGAGILALSGIIALMIAFLTVSYQSYKAAVSNPVDTLRTE
ncbi:ABC transporter permease [Fulvivirgaceae bacterium BMA10]|uniref:ABC transporter permease n=1 Tax=Splendidivirga corallicola TaxID=3051826 RepID=A0ABT8KN01_9BACT|nr:ABC transporter permease [Fulvivirgaceae bacterium BMA10]